jgi:hypothetical protein
VQTQTKRILTSSTFFDWVLFVGVGIKTGALFFSFIVTGFINPVACPGPAPWTQLSD